MYQVILVIVTLSTIMARVALLRATIPENITDGQISIFQVMDDINKLVQFTTEYLPTDHNPFFNQTKSIVLILQALSRATLDIIVDKVTITNLT